MANENGGNGGTGTNNSGARLRQYDDLSVEAESRLNRARGNARRATAELLAELRDATDRAHKAETELAEAKKKIPADGSLMLTAEQAKEWAVFSKLSTDLELKASEIEEALTEYDAMLGTEEQRKFDEVVAQAAEDIGWNPKALPVILRDKGLTVEMRDVIVPTDDGKRRKESLLHVRPANDDKAPWELVDEYVERELEEYLPMLQSVATDDTDLESGEGMTMEGGEGEEEEGTTEGASSGNRRSLYSAVGSRKARTRGAREGREGVEFPAQRAPRPSTGRTDLRPLLEKKAARGEYVL